MIEHTPIKSVEGLHLVEYPNEVLTCKAESMEFTEDNIGFCLDFIDFYKKVQKRIGKQVVGLAAPQVGKSLRVFIAYGEIYINPEITWLPSKGTETIREGCLSLPLTMFWEKTRPYSVRIKYQDMSGKWQEKKFNNMNARVVLHEMDHLEGVLCCGSDYKLNEE